MQHFFNMIFLLEHVVKINYYTDVKEDWENVIHELLEDCRSIIWLKGITAYLKDL